MIEPGTVNLTMYQGANYDRAFTITTDGTPMNLTGYTARMVVKQFANSIAVLDIATGTGITLGGAAGTININLTYAQTAGIVAGKYRYDLELYSGGPGIVTRILQGTVTVEEQISA